MFPSVHYLGRRTILLWGAAAETVCMFAFAIVGTAAPNSVAAARCLVAFSCLYAFFFTWSWGPVAWIVASEVGSNVMRSRTQALGSAVSWAGTLLIAVVLPYLINPTAANLGAKVSSTQPPSVTVSDMRHRLGSFSGSHVCLDSSGPCSSFQRQRVVLLKSLTSYSLMQVPCTSCPVKS